MTDLLSYCEVRIPAAITPHPHPHPHFAEWVEVAARISK